MPTRDDADHVVTTKNGLLNAVTKDNATVYIADDIDVSGAKNVRLGDNVTLVGGFCDPNVTSNGGRGPVIRQKHYERHLFISKWGKAPTLWGVSLRGPNTSYFDPRDRVKSSDWDSDSADDWYASGLWCYDESELEVYGCEFFGWTLAGLEIGSRGHKTPATIERSSFHHCIMETLGYGIEHYNGDVWVDRCFFDACRHGFSGFGYPGETVDITNCVIGPADDTEGWCGHALDMHKLEDNLHNGDWTAGGHFRIRNCTSMCTWDLNGYDQEGFAIRGTSEEPSWEDKNHWFQKKKPKAPGKQGDAYRQEVQDRSEGWQNFEPRDSVYGEMTPANVSSEYGAPRASERAGEDDEDEQTDDPSEQPATDTMQLTVHGKGIAGRYWIVVKGSAEATGNIEDNDQIKDIGNDRVELTGGIVGAADTYELSDGAIPERAGFGAPCRISLDGEDITGHIAPVESNRRFDELQQRIDNVRQWVGNQLDSLSIVSGGDGS